MINEKDKDKKIKDLESTFSQIEKQFGKGSVNFGNSKQNIPILCSTGSIKLDNVIGVGGIPQGRTIEIYGPESSGKTTITLWCIAQIQKAGGICAFIDAEHALDRFWAIKLGVNMEELIISQPDSGEEALEICESFVDSKSIDFIVIDSVAALVPKAEIAGEMGDSHMGLQARLMGQAMRKLTGKLSKSQSTICFINQIRHKIGVMFGCFHYDTLINFVNGESIPIGKVVDDKIKGKIWSLNEKTNKLEIKEIIDWHDNGLVEIKEDFIHIQTSSINGGGRFGFTCTSQHKILTNNGWKKAEDISFEDKLISKYKQTINGTYENFLNGIFIGDSTISIRSENTGSLKLQDNKNIDYINWKLDKLSKFITFSEIEINKGYRYNSDYTYELSKIKKELKKRNPMYMLKNFNLLSFALWMMDDGHLDLNGGHKRYSISVKRFKNNENILNQIKNILNNNDFLCDYDLKDGTLKFKTSITNFIAKSICKYIPECMQYKLPEEYRGQYKEFKLENNPVMITDMVEIKEIRFSSNRQIRNKRKFDITVEDNHNYMVGGIKNGVIVHNSPETTTGGNALKFFATIRFDVRKLSEDKEIGKEDEGQLKVKLRIKAVKNKVAAPFKSCELFLYTGKDGIYGFNMIDEIVDLGVSKEIIKKAGTWYSYNEERICQGKNNVINYLKNNKEIAKEIKNKILEKMDEEISYSTPIEGSIEDIKNKEEIKEEIKKRKPKNKKDENIIEEEMLIEEVNSNEEEINVEEKEK